jgi:flagellar basal-body rod modification protein FlgD
MASIGTLLPTSNTDSTNQSNGSAASGASDPTQSLGNEQTFLQLLVAQLKNQDPSQPQDGTQFVAQLAQFSNLEQSIGMKADLDTIKSKFVAPTSTAGSLPAGINGTTAA